MKNLSSICLACLMPAVYTAAQNVVGGIPGKGLDMQTNAGGFVTQLPAAPPETKGDVYLNSEWANGEITIYQDETELKHVSVRLDLLSNNIEINSQNKVKVLDGARVKQFKITDNNNGEIDTYINGKSYTFKGTPINGFFRVISSGRWELLARTELKLIEGGYVAALDAGDKNRRIVKEVIYFFAQDLELYRVYPSSKKFSSQFKGSAGGMKEFLKENKLSLKKKEDLQVVLNYLNEQF